MAKQNGRVPKLVIVDYLQIMASHNNKFNLSEKQIVDKNITELKRICRDRDVAIIVVSSLNRDSYKDGEEVTLKSFKESGGIEYSCDVLMGLQLLGMKNNDQNDDKAYENLLNASIRKVELVILKNRAYKAREKIYFDYHTKFDCFLEELGAPKSQVENSKANLVGSNPGLIK